MLELARPQDIPNAKIAGTSITAMFMPAPSPSASAADDFKENRFSAGGRKVKKKVRVTKSSNVFADIGLPNAAEHSIKADLVIAIAARIKARGLTQAKAASLLGLAQSDVSKLLRGHFAGYSYERLFGYLMALGGKVRIQVSEAKTKKDARLELEMTG
jgi:predicted XRE-type DNA-binding protein